MMESVACRTWRSILDDISPCHTVARWNTTDDLWLETAQGTMFSLAPANWVTRKM